jgi:hypothetical protein
MRLVLVMCVLLGCSDTTSERVLRLGGGEFSESQLRTSYRAGLIHPQGETLCRSVQDLSDREAVAVIMKYQELTGTNDKQQPGQDQDRERAAAILKQECRRLFDR